MGLWRRESLGLALSADAALSALSAQQGKGRPTWMLVCAALLCRSQVCKNSQTNVKDRRQMICLYFTMKKKIVWIQSNAFCLVKGAWGEGGLRRGRVLSGPSTAGDQRLACTTSDVRCGKGATAGGLGLANGAEQPARLELSGPADKDQPSQGGAPSHIQSEFDILHSIHNMSSWRPFTVELRLPTLPARQGKAT